jgi:transcriptional regulator with XRE-family HTH domain
MRALVKDALREVLDKTGMDQRELAKEIGVSPATISNYMNKNLYPILKVAAIIYHKWGYYVEPYTEWAIERELEIMKKMNMEEVK